MIHKFETSKFLSQINQTKLIYQNHQKQKYKNHKYIIKINELQQIIRFLNSQTEKMDECMNQKLKSKTELFSVEYLEFYDFLNQLNEDLSDLIFSIDKFDTDFINNRLECILNNNCEKNTSNYYQMNKLVKTSGYYLTTTFVKYFT
jgi:hypothetical protein